MKTENSTSSTRASVSPTSIQIKALEVTYPNGYKALHSTSLNITQGSFVVLLGTSGAGKSTLLRSLNGLVQPSKGSVLIEGLGDLANAITLKRHRRQTGMVFQQHHLIGRLSVLNNVLLGRLGYHAGWRMFTSWTRAEKEQALAVIERVGLLDRALTRADQLSGGQQQRVGMARALIQQPKILLADEPVASLDPNTSVRLLQSMHDICKSDGLTAVVSLHQVDLARQFADRIIGLKGGAVVFDGMPEMLTPERAEALYQHINTSHSTPEYSSSVKPSFQELSLSGV
ncbi:phosphonate ABC transporter ATP-binding protein [Zwartia sp.]|uniref:phosphonate ABC transporter ATP-binding protein n=1 Tax=Zwartia sp. TaxID=2978004 RepID=UPI002723142F|nr:phosphonate ABC transporter ATP-binding protein [Zwartia sp.]MDO9023333.1 phosphonate ABC transporter ATP-binding protein [Zwartia sp.]